MRRVEVFSLLLVACSSSSQPRVEPKPAVETRPKPLRAEGPGTIGEGTFESAALGVVKRYRIYLPGGYEQDTAARWPVVFLLHGLSGSEDNWVEYGDVKAVADALALPAIVVMPDGDDSFYVNAATPVDHDTCLAGRPVFGRDPDMSTYCVRERRYEDYIVKDLVAHVDATYRTIPERRARAIGGLSMGGTGALTLAMRHPDVFASAASHSGVDALLYAGPHPYQAGKAVLLEDLSLWGGDFTMLGDHMRGIYGTKLDGWRERDPAWLAGRLKDGDLALYLDCGSEDQFQLQDGAQYLHDLLLERGVAHAWYLGPGRHDFRFWKDRLDDSLTFHLEAFRKAGLSL